MKSLPSSLAPLIWMKAPLAATTLVAAIFGAQIAAAQQTDEPTAPILRPVKLMTVTANTGGITRTFFGQVAAKETVDLAFQVGGQIIDFPVIEGQIVPKGGLIAQLDQEPFELQLDQAQLQFEQAERTLNRFNQLTGTAVSRVAADDAETQFGLSKIALRNAEYSLEHATLHAPFEALVASRNVANFTTVGAGNAIVRLHDMSDLRIQIDVPEVLFQRAGDSAAVQLFARFPVGDTLYPLQLREYVAEASSVGQTFQLTLGLDRPDGLNVLPGSSVTVLATILQEKGNPVIPATALRIANDGSTTVMVFTPKGDDKEGDTGTVQERAVKIAANREGKFEVLEGLETGEEIALTGANALENGQTVRRFSGFVD